MAEAVLAERGSKEKKTNSQMSAERKINNLTFSSNTSLSPFKVSAKPGLAQSGTR